MYSKEKAGKRLRNASTAYSKAYKRNYGQLCSIKQDQPLWSVISNRLEGTPMALIDFNNLVNWNNGGDK